MKELQIAEDLHKDGKTDEAIEIYRKNLQSNPNSAITYFALARLFIQKGYWKQAIESYQQGVSLEPNKFSECYGFGSYLNNLGYQDKAIILYRRIGKVLAHKDKVTAAIEWYQSAIKLNLEPQYFHLYIGDLQRRKDNLTAAIFSYLQAISISPGFWEPHDRILIIVQRQEVKSDLLEKMVYAYQQVIKQRPNYLFAYSNLGNILTKLGKLEEAINYYQRASYRQNLQLKPEFVANAWDTSKQGHEPKFMIIGSMRCGTTSLYEYLTQHPMFIPAIKKEVKFFNFNFESGKSWYQAHFPAIADHTNYLTGEASPDYLYYPYIAKKIAALFPKMKLILMLRNPVDRSISQYYHWLKVGAEYRPLETVIESELNLIKQMAQPDFDGKIKGKRKIGCLLESVYIYFLEKWLAIFPREQLLILKSEDFYTNPPVIVNQVCKFIGLSDYQLTEYKAYNAGSYTKIDASTRQTLVDCFRPHNQRLEESLGINFGWDN